MKIHRFSIHSIEAAYDAVGDETKALEKRLFSFELLRCVALDDYYDRENHYVDRRRITRRIGDMAPSLAGQLEARGPIQAFGQTWSVRHGRIVTSLPTEV